MVGEFRNDTKKVMKTKSLILDSLKSNLDRMMNTENPYSELIAFLTSNFNIMLEESQNYIKLFNDLIKNYIMVNTSMSTTNKISELYKLQENIQIETKNKLEYVIKKVSSKIIRIV